MLLVGQNGLPYIIRSSQKELGFFQQKYAAILNECSIVVFWIVHSTCFCFCPEINEDHRLKGWFVLPYHDRISRSKYIWRMFNQYIWYLIIYWNIHSTPYFCFCAEIYEEELLKGCFFLTECQNKTTVPDWCASFFIDQSSSYCIFIVLYPHHIVSLSWTLYSHHTRVLFFST